MSWILLFQPYIWSSVRMWGLCFKCFPMSGRPCAAYTTTHTFDLMAWNGNERQIIPKLDIVLTKHQYYVWKTNEKLAPNSTFLPGGYQRLCQTFPIVHDFFGTWTYIMHRATFQWILSETPGSKRRSAKRPTGREWKGCWWEASVCGRDKGIALHKGAWKLFY